LQFAQQFTPDFLTPAAPFDSVNDGSQQSRRIVFDCANSRTEPTNNPGEAVANPIVTLTTDYGTNDHLVGTLKGVLLKINPELTIVDITHHVSPYDLLDGALTIGAAYSYFPPRTIHIVVVDPGVGTTRRPLLVTAQNQYFVAPDNGVLSLVYEREQDNLVVRHATAEHYFLQPISKTFHGRDIFAPVAAWLSKGWQTAAMGEEIQDFQRFTLPRPKPVDGGSQGVVLRIDAFGNVMTNFRAEDLSESAKNGGGLNLKVGTHTISRLVDTFASGAADGPIAYVGSSGYLEIGINKANAARKLAIARGAAVILPKS
jgi:S-adenosylmethionine hydrolase